MKLKAYLTIGMVGFICIISNANAEGFFAGALRDVGLIDEKTREELDDFHGGTLGRPLDKALGKAVDNYVPGASIVYETAKEISPNLPDQKSEEPSFTNPVSTNETVN